MRDLAEDIQQLDDEDWDTLEFMIRCRVTRTIALMWNAAPEIRALPDRLASAIDFTPYLQRERLNRRHREAQRRKITNEHEVYSPAMLRRFLEWDGDSCAFPLCEERDFLRNRWHLCPMHSNRFSIAMSNRKTRAGIKRERIRYGVSGTTN